MKGLGLNKTLTRMNQRKRSMLRKMGNSTLHLFQVENFNNQGFKDRSVKKWKKVLTKKPGEKIGIETGRMRRSGKSTVRSSSRAVVSFDAPYSSYFNKKRRLVGKSEEANKRNKKIITKHLQKVFN